MTYLINLNLNSNLFFINIKINTEKYLKEFIFLKKSLSYQLLFQKIYFSLTDTNIYN